MSLFSQGTVDDYKRAMGLRALHHPSKVINGNLLATWIDGELAFFYRQESVDNGWKYTLVDAKTGKKKQLFDHKRLAKAISNETGTTVSPDSISLDNLKVEKGIGKATFAIKGQKYSYDIKSNSLVHEGAVPPLPVYPHWMVVPDEKGGAPVTSPDGSKIAYIKNDNIYVKTIATGEERQLSNDGTLGNYYSDRIVWSPDGTKVALCKLKPAEKRYVYYVESSPSDQAQPKLHKQEYAKPGDERDFKIPAIFDVNTGEASIPETTLFDHQYELYGPEWNEDSKAVTFEYNERGHKVYRVLELSATGGDVRTLIEESHPKYVNYPRNYRYNIPGGEKMIWSSERDGYQHLYMVDRAKGDIDHQITKGPWYVRKIVNIDPESETIIFSANGVNASEGEDPYHIRYYRINFDGTEFTDITPDAGTHKAIFSPDFKYLVDTYSSVSEPPVTVLRNATDGSVISEIERADISQLVANGWKAPEVFVAPGRDGKTPMWGLIYRPTNFDSKKTYPIIEYIYQGPGDQYVPKAFASHNYYMSSLAELGFIVVMVDGMSTSWRSREFENVCYKNLKDAGLPDHMEWIKAMVKKYPYMDIDRVGIFGCSAGGQESTNALLLYPDFYKAAFSACGCHDNRMDKIWWNELWMGYPVDESYAACSNTDNAHLLKRPLMLLVGELDDNVDPASTMQVVNALIKANKDFELVVIPGAHHTMGEEYGEHKRYDFFVRNLLGVNPPAWNELEP